MFAVAFGCTDRPPVEESPQGAIQAYAEARCGAFARCECLTDAELEECVETTRSQVEDVIEAYTGPIDVSCLQTAVRTWEDGSCAVADYEDVESCQLADFNGVGEPCMWVPPEVAFFTGHHCAPGLYCDGQECAPAQSVPEGGECARTEECPVGLICIDQRCSSERVDLGQSCVSHEQCMLFAYCDTGVCAPTLDQFAPCEESAACSMPFVCRDGICDFPAETICTP